MSQPNLEQRVAALLDRELRPTLRASGGDVELVEVAADGVVKIRLVGTCRSCPSSAMALIHGLDQQLSQEIPEVAYMQVVGE